MRFTVTTNGHCVVVSRGVITDHTENHIIAHVNVLVSTKFMFIGYFFVVFRLTSF